MPQDEITAIFQSLLGSATYIKIRFDRPTLPDLARDVTPVRSRLRRVP